MGKPGRSHVLSPMPEYIGHVEGTWGITTTSKVEKAKRKK